MNDSNQHDWRREAEQLKRLKPRHVLFLCVANSARSQLGEGLARHLAPAGTKVSSAGSEPGTLNPVAVEVMREIGVDISSHFSKSVDDFDPKDVDAVVTLCADEVCPVFLGKAIRVHWGLPDPGASGLSDEDRRRLFREVRDELLRRLEVVFGVHGSGGLAEKL